MKHEDSEDSAAHVPAAPFVEPPALSPKTFRSSPIGIMARRLDPVIAEALDRTASVNFPPLKLEGQISELGRLMEAGLASSGFGSEWLAK